MTTPSELYDLIRGMAFDADVSLAGESDLFHYMTVAERIVAKKIPCTETTATDSTVIDQREYDRPASALKIKRVTWNKVKLKKISINDLDIVEGVSYGGISSSGNVVYYYEYGNVVGLSPLPAAIQELKFWFTLLPPALTSISTAFTIPEEYIDIIPEYCLYRLYLKDDMKGEADRSLNLFNNRILEYQDDWSQRTQEDYIQVVRLDEISPTTDIGMV
jgi:hypothetical protein